MLASAPTITRYSRYYSFVVSYYDSAGFDLSSFDGNDILVTSGNGFTGAASLTSVVRGWRSTIRVATYTVHGPGRAWDASDNAGYSINLQPNQVRDTGGRFAAAGVLGTFTVNIPAPAIVPAIVPTTMVFQTRRKILEGPVWDRSA